MSLEIYPFRVYRVNILSFMILNSKSAVANYTYFNLLKNMKLILVMLICVQHLTALKHGLLLSPSPNRVNTDLVKSVNFIIENVYLKRFQTVNIISAVENPFDFDFFDFQNALLNENKGCCIYRLDYLTKIQNIRNRLKIGNIFLLDSYKSFRILFEHIVPEKFNFRGFYLFVLINGRLEELNIIFSALWRKGIINANAMYTEKNNETIQLVTFKPFQENTCGNTLRVVLDTLKDGKFTIEADEIFPNKAQNLFGCEIRMVTFERCPASCVKTNGSKVTVEGFDISIIDLISERLNFSLNKRILLGSEQWGNVLPNGTTTGAIAKVLKNESDIAIGNYFLRLSRVDLMDYSSVYFSFPVLFAIPLGDKYTAFEKLMRPFELIVWVLLLITIGFGLLVILLLNLKWRKLRSFVFGTGIKNPVTNMYDLGFF